MSADLFAEFGAEADSTRHQAQQQSLQPAARPGIQQTSSYAFFDGWSATCAAAPAQQQQQHQPASCSSATDAWTARQAPAQKAVEDDIDDWGDFEEAGSSSEPPVAPPPQAPFAAAVASLASARSQDDSYGFGFGPPKQTQLDPSSWQRAPIVKAKKSTDPSVLFDAEEDHLGRDVVVDVFGDDDEFGEFEGTEERTVTNNDVSAGPSSALVIDLLGDLPVSQPMPSVTRESKHGHHHPRQPSKRSLSAVAPAAKQNPDEAAWDAFDDWEPSIPDTAPILSPTPEDPRPDELPPTNVPPPGVLLSLIPSIIHEAQEKLFKPMAAQPLVMRNRLMAEPATIAYLAGYLVLANVAAHIIAGRKLRWKRDQHLSQGMRIGPASSRATSGMKLTGIDKGESTKEDSEVGHVVRLWKEHVGRLRHVVSGANQRKAGTLGPVPDVQEVMPVRTLKQCEGGMPARQPCMLCGLKREERVTAADLATDDSFGAWWIDQVNMHRGCRNFWNQHKDALRQR